MNVREHVPWLASAILMLVVGVLAGLARMGWRLPVIDPGWIAQHGPLMVTGFLGTLITLERAVALRARAALLGAVFFALGGLMLLLGVSDQAARVLTLLGSLWLMGIFIHILREHSTLHTWVMAAGAGMLLVGAVLGYSGGAVIRLIPWWIAFLLMTIAGERLELGRILALRPSSRALFLVSASLFITGVILSSASIPIFNLIYTKDIGLRVMGLGLMAMAVWHLRFDIARRTVRQKGLTRFIAVCMLSGYVWLLLGGVLYLVFGLELGGLRYDAQLHAVFLGFVFLMIFGHAPIIFPAILGRAIQYHPRFYIHYGLLQLSLLLRISGDLLLIPELRLWGGMLNGIALLIFLFNVVLSVVGSGKDYSPGMEGV